MTFRRTGAPSALDQFPDGIPANLAAYLFGDELGRGTSRVVYVDRLDPDYVFKCSTYGDPIQNVLEFKMFEAVHWDATAEGDKRAEVAREWLAPVNYLSNDGLLLRQRRTTPIAADQLPAKVPAFLADLKRANFGMLDGRVVAHDYGYMPGGGFSVAMKRADWRHDLH